MMVAPNVGWSNAIPDAAGEVDFEVNGEKFQFNGSAYHDHVSLLTPSAPFVNWLTFVLELGSPPIPGCCHLRALGPWPLGKLFDSLVHDLFCSRR
jgi:hypothetical protein